jgi:hypothetical protein
MTTRFNVIDDEGNIWLVKGFSATNSVVRLSHVNQKR